MFSIFPELRCCSAPATKSFNRDAEVRPPDPARPDGAHKRQPTTDEWSVSELLPLSDGAEPKEPKDLAAVARKVGAW